MTASMFRISVPLFVAAFAAPLALVHAQAVNPNSSRSNTQHNVADLAVAKCMVAGKPCTAAQVQDLATGLAAGKRVHQTLAAIKNVSLASPDGTLSCEQNDGTPCTAAQVKDLNSAAPPTYSINYNSSKSNTGNVTAPAVGVSAPKSNK